jgi:hypothetical protein
MTRTPVPAKAVPALMRRAWDMPDIRAAWDALALAYGEL